MYSIRKEENYSPTKLILIQTTSFGLGITIFQLCLELQNIVDLAYEAERNPNCEGCIRTETSFETGEGADDKTAKVKLRLPVHSNQEEFQGLFIIGILLYAKIVLSLVNIYSYVIVRIAVQKESLCDCWLGLYLQISLLAYNMTEILIEAYKGTFDGSSMALAARATVRAISIEMICLFLRELQVKQEIDVFLYSVLNV